MRRKPDFLKPNVKYNQNYHKNETFFNAKNKRNKQLKENKKKTMFNEYYNKTCVICYYTLSLREIIIYLHVFMPSMQHFN